MAILRMFALLCLALLRLRINTLLVTNSQITTGVTSTFIFDYYNCCSPAHSHNAAKLSV